MQFCPKCGSKSLVIQDTPAKLYTCSECTFTLFQNVAAAVMVVITCKDEVLIAIRGREPGIGMWDFPGGFADPDETLEEAVIRELYEELDLVVDSAIYVGSNPNTYPYKDIIYKTCDSFFVVELDEKPKMKAQDDVAQILWVAITDVEISKFAFESAKVAFQQLIGFKKEIIR
ncbi:NUDIX hydrolase [Vibrio algarum]|uniref:NUDIX domain-containing protein n=1 Tax=Vibrio algarum TaxID=3020714 RepID=A0ABT4YWF2_9VIBR|nr:NUDIX domain-containing protein [Vibrio sp. KJ40-1]MDB1125838.1 NUDIX domain-containing protein [Vibrio sp. KJ40-1]